MPEADAMTPHASPEGAERLEAALRAEIARLHAELRRRDAAIAMRPTTKISMEGPGWSQHWEFDAPRDTWVDFAADGTAAQDGERVGGEERRKGERRTGDQSVEARIAHNYPARRTVCVDRRQRPAEETVERERLANQLAVLRGASQTGFVSWSLYPAEVETLLSILRAPSERVQGGDGDMNPSHRPRQVDELAARGFVRINDPRSTTPEEK